ncbi:NAD(P)-dependent oxidoreductase [Candidatus Dependentiae bacterium]|nr:NAD(P)-dependent oxidoreductase [Candidatus Dependentiae bacterium]
MKRYLIVGGDTFIGAHLVRRLVKDGKEVHIIVQSSLNLWRIHDVMLSIKMHTVDLSNEEDVFDVLNKIKASVIISAISHGETIGSGEIDEIYDQNFFNLLILIQQAKQVGFSCFINSGSYQEYGRRSSALAETQPTEALSHYGIAKAAATMHCLKEARLFNLPIYTVRSFVPYGLYQSSQSFLTKLFSSTLTSVNFNNYYANASYDFIHISDIVNIYIAIAQHTPNNQFIFNAGSGISRKLRDVVQMFEETCLQPTQVEWSLLSESANIIESSQLCYSDQTITNSFFESFLPPQKDFKLGIKETYEWFLKNNSYYISTQKDQKMSISNS